MKINPAVEGKESAYVGEHGTYRLPDGNIDYCTTEKEVARLIHSVVMLLRPRIVVETGVFHGYTSYYIAKALKEIGADGHLYCIDPMPTRHFWEEDGLDDRITFIQTTSAEALDRIPANDIDMILIDSEHTYRTSMFELSSLEPRLRDGGVLLMHDAVLHDGVGLTAMEIYKNPRFEVVALDTIRRLPGVADVTPGLLIARKIRSGFPEFETDPTLHHLPDTAAKDGGSALRAFVLRRSFSEFETDPTLHRLPGTAAKAGGPASRAFAVRRSFTAEKWDKLAAFSTRAARALRRRLRPGV